jgi:hypothetical protein
MSKDTSEDLRTMSQRLASLQELLTRIETASSQDSLRLTEAMSRIQILEANVRRLRARLGVPEEQ